MPPSPLLGFNNNVRHKGIVFHVQTEDSGVKHPHIITHLFMDGGRIVKTLKTSYAEHLGKEKYEDTVKKMMKEQHKAMFIALRDGELDALIEAKMRPGGQTKTDEAGDAAAAKDAASAEPAPKAEAPKAEAPKRDSDKSPAAKAASVRPAPDLAIVEKPAETAVPAKSDRPPKSVRPSSVRPAKSVRPAAREADRIHVPPSPPTPLDALPEPDGLAAIDIDSETLRRAALDSGAVHAELLDDLPPPPESVMGHPRIEGSYREVSERPTKSKPPSGRPQSSRRPPAAGEYSEVKPHQSRRPERNSERSAKARSKPPTGGSSSSNPAARGRPPVQQEARPSGRPSLFGNDHISEQSLDEVIMGYLAEDLDPTSKR